MSSLPQLVGSLLQLVGSVSWLPQLVGSGGPCCLYVPPGRASAPLHIPASPYTYMRACAALTPAGQHGPVPGGTLKLLRCCRLAVPPFRPRAGLAERAYHPDEVRGNSLT